MRKTHIPPRFHKGQKVYARSPLYGCNELSTRKLYTISAVLRHTEKDIYLYEFKETPEGYRYHQDRLAIRPVSLLHRLLTWLLKHVD